MKISENYENAKQKYGLEIVKLLSDYGLPPKYLQSACRYHKEEGVPIDRLILLFKEWMKYVVKYNQVDVNTLSYDVFLQTLAKGKSEHLLPNVLYKDENCTLFSIDNIKDARNLPNHYCIKAVDKYNILKEKGYLFLLIYLPQQQFPFTYVVASIHDGNVEYWDSQNYKMYNNEADDFRQEQYESLLPNEVKTIIQNMTENKQNINCNKIMKKNKNVMRLTESQLHRVIKESVKKVLKEGFGDGQIERALRRMLDTYMDPNNEEQSSAIDCFYYLWERAGYENVEVNYDTDDLNRSGIIFQDEEGNDAIIISPNTIYISPIFDYSNSTSELKKWNKWAVILQKEVIKCIENA